MKRKGGWGLSRSDPDVVISELPKKEQRSYVRDLIEEEYGVRSKILLRIILRDQMRDLLEEEFGVRTKIGVKIVIKEMLKAQLMEEFGVKNENQFKKLLKEMNDEIIKEMKDDGEI